MKKKIRCSVITFALAFVLLFALALSGCDSDSVVIEDGYTVTLNYNDSGASRDRSILVAEGDSMAQPATPVRTGYTFSYWSTSEEGSDTVSFPYTPTGDITLYAQWTAAVYTVTFDYNGGTLEGETSASISKSYNEEVTASEADAYAPERDGYWQNGWVSKAEGGSTVSFPYVIKKDTTFYANWVSNDITWITISFDANYDGADEIDSVTILQGETVSVDDPSRTGYEFEGWALTADADADDVLNLKTYTFDSDTTLYAVWTQQTYNIYFQYNYYYVNSSGTKTSAGRYKRLQVAGGDEVEQPDDPTRDGYEFIGWYTTAVGGSEIEFPFVAEKSGSYYAHWKSEQVTTTYFDAEYVPIDSSTEYYGYSGSTKGTGCISTDSDGSLGASVQVESGWEDYDTSGYYVTYQYQKGNTLTFTINASAADTSATLYLCMAGEFIDGSVTFAPEGETSSGYGYDISVNGTSLAYGTFSVTETFREVKSIAISLQAGENVIELMTNNSTSVHGGTTKATAPMVDYIRISSSATLTWSPEYDNLETRSA